jgi:hypothetical protein
VPRQVYRADAPDEVGERPWLIHDQLFARNNQNRNQNGRG